MDVPFQYKNTPAVALHFNKQRLNKTLNPKESLKKTKQIKTNSPRLQSETEESQEKCDAAFDALKLAKLKTIK